MAQKVKCQPPAGFGSGLNAANATSVPGATHFTIEAGKGAAGFSTQEVLTAVGAAGVEVATASSQTEQPPFGPNPRPSAAGIELIAQFEGFSPSVYNDPTGNPTVGFGHLVRPGETFSDPLTRQQGLDLLGADVERVAGPGLDMVNVALSQNQVDSLGSFIFNVGPGAFGRSTLLRELNAGNFGAVPGQIRRFAFSQGQRLPGLVRRREAEAQLFGR
jgi:lysozyme